MDNIVAYAVAYAITYARLLDKNGYDRNWIRFHLFFLSQWETMKMTTKVISRRLNLRSLKDKCDVVFNDR